MNIVLETLSGMIDYLTGTVEPVTEFSLIVEADIRLVRRLRVQARNATEAKEKARSYYRQHWSGVLDEVVRVDVRADVATPMKVSPLHPTNHRKGQAVLEFTLMTPLLLGLLAFFVDIGFGQWRHLQTQSMAQGAAMSSAINAMSQIDLVCGSGVVCGTGVACPGASGNLATGCQYATLGASSTFKTTTTLTAGSGAPSGVTNVATAYWVTATVSETIMPLFGSGLTINATSTAAVWSVGSNKGVFLVQ